MKHNIELEVERIEIKDQGRRYFGRKEGKPKLTIEMIKCNECLVSKICKEICPKVDTRNLIESYDIDPEILENHYDRFANYIMDTMVRWTK